VLDVVSLFLLIVNNFLEHVFVLNIQQEITFQTENNSSLLGFSNDEILKKGFKSLFINPQFSLNEADVKMLMKKELKFSSYKLWRKRVENCKTKHLAKRVEGIDRFKCKLQRAITNNKISKR
jgi:uncharacterized protein (TIGR03643 family)